MRSLVGAAEELFIRLGRGVDDWGPNKAIPQGSVRYKKPSPKPQSQPMVPSDKPSVRGFEDYTGGEVRRTKRPQLSPQDKQDYLEYGQKYFAENKTLKGAMKVNHEGDIIGLKKNSGLRKDGTPSLKTRNETKGKAYQDEGRRRKEREQTMGKDSYKDLKGHHRAGVDIIDRLLEGLSEADRARIKKAARRKFGALGNEDFNLDQLPEDVHGMVHTELKKMGLDSERMDFSTADLQTRLKFINVLGKALEELDKKTFSAMSPGVVNSY